jgi:hypothetical protein
MPELAALVIAASLGAMVFFSSIVAPTIFRILPEDKAGLFLRAVFPNYFLINGVAALLAAAIAFRPLESGLLAACAAMMLAVRFVAIPIINNARDLMLSGDVAAKDQFNLWHRGTVIANTAEMIILVIIACLLLGYD